ncbi:MAG: GNAT family N-acetyltransferase [Methylorubrum rhodinum]|uniref:GNAT family N-acetyltransferase n=1 Tax=Methylorubrum rhodinum TaxID=29428 RepID=UPI003BB07D4E
MEPGELERLNEHHDVSAFDAGPTDTEGQAAWLRDRAISNDARGNTRVFVTPYAGTKRVGGFFGIAPGSVIHQGLPRRLRPHGTPPIIPAWFIARLAVDVPLQGRGVGRDLMLAALSRIVKLHQDGGGALVVVDAASDKAQRLYAGHRFVPLTQTNPEARTTRMVAPMADVIELLREP